MFSKRDFKEQIPERNLLEIFLYFSWEEGFNLSEDFSPVTDWLIPFLGDTFRTEIEDFFKGSFRREDLSRFGDFSDLPMKSLDGIGGIDEPPQIITIHKVGGEFSPVLFPTTHGDRIGLFPSILQS